LSHVLSTADVLQAAGDTALEIAGLAPLFPDAALCAPAATCGCAPGDNLALHHALLVARPGDVLVCETGGNTSVGHFGELMALDALAQGLAGLVIDGAVRDSGPVAGHGFPVFHVGLAPRAAAKERAGSAGEPVVLRGVTVHPGDQVVADRDAVLVVPRADWPEVRAAAEALVEREATIRAELAEGRRLADVLGLSIRDET
jgi:4-hydroxy-4-methyl-2-oxoglutarate aldolase